MPARTIETIGDRLTKVGRDNHFTTIRAFATTAVVFSHAYIVVIAGWETADYVHLFGSPANHAVHAFFFLSGFLLTMSLVRKPDTLQFMIARLLRLTPAIVASALVLALIVSPLVTGLPLADYFNVSELTSFMVSIARLIQMFASTLQSLMERWSVHDGLPSTYPFYR